VHDQRQRRGRLAVHRGATQPRGLAQRLQPRGQVRSPVDVHGAAAAVVAGVERSQQVDDLATADLPDDQPVGPHPQRLADQVAQRHRAGGLHVRRPGEQPDDVRVHRRQLRGVLAEHQPLARVDQPQQRGEHRRLAGAGATGDQEREPGAHRRGQQAR
jgi:hypothetical protein